MIFVICVVTADTADINFGGLIEGRRGCNLQGACDLLAIHRK